MSIKCLLIIYLEILFILHHVYCRKNYIVLLNSNDPLSIEDHMSWVTQEASKHDSFIIHRYDFMGMKGYSGSFDYALIQKIESQPIVHSIEKDHKIYINDDYGIHKKKMSRIYKQTSREKYQNLDLLSQPKTCSSDKDDNYKCTIQKNSIHEYKCTIQKEWVNWGLKQISDSDDNTYIYPSSAGEGVTIYVLDTGINCDHVEFEKRAKWGKTFVGRSTDAHGHGTHVAGIIAGKIFGVAKKATVVAVKVMDDKGYGSISNIIAGINWVVAQFEANNRPPTVINLSNGGPYSYTWNVAIEKVIMSGIHFTVAAGNENENSCFRSPSSSEKVVVVGSSEENKRMANYSNIGPCVSIFAPGSNIRSSWAGSPTDYVVVSGSSQAAPYVAGVIALYLSCEKYKNYNPHQMKALLESTAHSDELDNVPDNTVNKLLTITPLLKELNCI